MNKPTNPKDDVGIKKVYFSVVPPRVIGEVSLGLLEGRLEYGGYNWREAGVRASVYYNAARRHIEDWWEGLDVDKKSGLHHVTKAICSLIVLRDAMIQGKYEDDRPPKSIDYETWIDEMNAKAAALLERYPSPPESFTQARRERECTAVLPPPSEVALVNEIAEAEVAESWAKWREKRVSRAVPEGAREFGMKPEESIE